MGELQNRKCRSCKHEWHQPEPSDSEPRPCPNCSIPQPLLRLCTHCSYQWEQRHPRRGQKPRQCPNCKSSNWDKPPESTARTPGEKPPASVGAAKVAVAI